MEVNEQSCLMNRMNPQRRCATPPLKSESFQSHLIPSAVVETVFLANSWAAMRWACSRIQPIRYAEGQSCSKFDAQVLIQRFSADAEFAGEFGFLLASGNAGTEFGELVMGE